MIPIHTYLLLCYNLLRITCHKLFHPKRYQVHPIQRISPRAALKLFGKATLHIGYNTEISAGCDFEAHGNGTLTIGEGTYFNRYCMISAHESVRIGKHCMFGPGVKIFDNNHRFSKEEGVSSQLNCEAITIGDRCWIASDAIILKGTHIGDHCVIGAGCLVSGDIPAGSIVKRHPDTVCIPMHPSEFPAVSSETAVRKQ